MIVNPFYNRNPIYWGKTASGILFFCNNKILLTHRSPLVDRPNTWGIPGGAVDNNSFHESTEANQETLDIEKCWNSAKKETIEELGSIPKINYFDKVIFKDGSFKYVTFFVRISEAICKNWSFILNWENTDVRWFDYAQLPSNLHIGVKFILAQEEFENARDN